MRRFQRLRQPESTLSQRRPPCVRNAVVLLEVVVAVSILLLAMAVVGGVFRNGQRTIELAERMTRAQIMTERLIVEMDTGILDMKEQEQSGEFGSEAIPGMGWRVTINPHARIPKLVNVDIEIFMKPPPRAEDSEEQGQEQSRAEERISLTRVQRPEPQGMDLKEDMGLDDDQIAMVGQVIPGGGEGGVFDPYNFDPRVLAQMPLDQLAETLPALVQAYGINLSGGQITALIEAVKSGNIGALQEAAQQAGGSLPQGLMPQGGNIPGMGQIPGGGASGSGSRSSPSGASGGQQSPPRQGGTRGSSGTRQGSGGNR